MLLNLYKYSNTYINLRLRSFVEKINNNVYLVISVNIRVRYFKDSIVWHIVQSAQIIPADSSFVDQYQVFV